LTFSPPKKAAQPLIRVETKFLQNSPQRVSKEAESLEFSKREKNVYRKTNFSEKKNFGNFLMKEILHIFYISVKFSFF
jgi:hypothetical protein